MRETAYAKINLALHVRGRESDGYHRIETIFAFAEEGDVLGAVAAEEVGLDVTGRFAAQLGTAEDNLVLMAARLLSRRSGISAGARLKLDKRLPVASGIGGGSADAAAALRLLDRFWRLGTGAGALTEIAGQIGADVPACIASRTARGEGRGDRLWPILLPELAGMPVLLVNPGIPLSTAEVFRAWGGKDGGPLEDWRAGRNDLEAPARALVPEIGAVLDALSGAMHARMSGSGATCFGLFRTERERDMAAAAIRAEHPDWWTLASRLR